MTLSWLVRILHDFVRILHDFVRILHDSVRILHDFVRIRESGSRLPGGHVMQNPGKVRIPGGRVRIRIFIFPIRAGGFNFSIQDRIPPWVIIGKKVFRRHGSLQLLEIYKMSSWTCV